MKKDWQRLFSSYDIRGIYGEQIDEEFALRLGAAFGALIAADGRGRFLVGHDARLSSPDLAAAFISGLLSGGHTVVDMELASTPLITWCGWSERFDGIVAITASHLSGQYNGFKLAKFGALPINAGEDLKRLKELFFEDSIVRGLSGSFKKACRLNQYVSMLKSFHKKAERRIRVGVDAGNGASCQEIALLSELLKDAVDMHVIFAAADGRFPNRSSNPLDDGALDSLSQLVLDQHLDFGVAFDGDGDRCIVVDEKGLLIEPDLILALIACELLKDNPGAAIVHDLRCSKSVVEEIVAAGARAVPTKVGYPFIRESLEKTQAVFGGELSGHYYFSDLNGIDNALRAAIELLNICAKTNGSLSELVKPLRRFHSSGEITIHSGDPKACIESLKGRYQESNATYMDGLSVEFGDWWFNARASGTESAVRLIVEAKEPSRLASNVAELTRMIKDS